MPNAGGLIIAPSIEMAEYMVALLEKIEGEKPMLVHSQMPNPNSKIRAFRETDKRWLVPVAMVSEGVDIKRLRVLLYLPNAMTENLRRHHVPQQSHEKERHCYRIEPESNRINGTNRLPPHAAWAICKCLPASYVAPSPKCSTVCEW